MEYREFPYHCGTKVIYNFWTRTQPLNFSKFVTTFIGIFIDAPDQKKSYEKMKKKYKILYQSPVLSRKGHGRDYFIVIWLNEKP